MYRFKVSKYKNVAPKMPKKEQTITEVPIGQIMASCGDFVSVSAKHIAFNVESGGGGCAGILPIDTVGRRNRKVPTIYAHSEFLMDMAFSPFDDDLLATCSYDGFIKLWDIPENFEDVLDNPLLKMMPDDTTKRLDMLRFHPIADEVLACASSDAISIVDLNAAETKTCTENSTGSAFQSIHWKYDGTLMITSCKDTKNRILDPRAESFVQTFSGFEGNKDSRLVWLGSTNYIFGTGFSKQRSRIIGIWDIRNTSSLVFNEDYGSGSGTIMPFHDIDTNIIILAGKGDPHVSVYEFSEANANVTLSSTQPLSLQTFGMGMAPKRILNVMEGEVDRMFQLSKNTITPLPYIIPRRSYRDFHADLFPDTVYSGKAAMDGEEWFSGKNKEGIKASLDPKIDVDKVRVSGLKVKRLSVCEAPAYIATKEVKESKKDLTEPKETVPEETSTTVNTNKDENQEVKEQKQQLKKENTSHDVPQGDEKPKPKGLKGLKMFKDVHQPKFKHLVGKSMHKSKNIENIKNLAESLPSESDGFAVYDNFVVVPLSGAGGRIAVFQLSNPGRLPESDIPVLQNAVGVLDFDMDPFNNRHIAVGCDDWHIRLWEIPEEGVTETLDAPSHILKGHEHRVTIVKYHPTASDILASASMDLTVTIWDLSDYSAIGSLEGHTDQIFCLAWHPDGKYLATYCKDGKIRIYVPVDDVETLKEGDGPLTTRGARITWCGPNNKWLLISSSSGKGRALHLYDSEDMKLLAETDTLDNSPSILSLHYDEGSGTIFATGKGDRVIFTYEINEKKPYLYELSHVKTPSLHQSVSFLRKDLVDVKNIEFARAARLTKNSIDFLSFTVPRVKPEYFQDDLFPDVRVNWNAALTGEEWLDDSEGKQEWISLQPKDMKKLSEAPKEAPKAAKYDSQNILSEKTDEEKKSELINAMMGKLDFDDKLEQDNFEGVEEDEWDD